MKSKPKVGPGAHERHLRRKMAHRELFEMYAPVAEEEVREARAKDGLEAEAFEEDFEVLLDGALGLAPNTPSETVLDLKARVDLLYTRAAGLHGDRSDVLRALRRLGLVITQAVRAAAQGDPAAMAKLDEEEMARERHYELLRFPLVADLLRQDLLIGADELVATMLSEQADAAKGALQIFSPEEQARICAEARTKLHELKVVGHELPEAWSRLRDLESVMEK